MEHFPFFKWLFTNPSSYFLKTFSSLSHVRLFSACVWGSMGAEKGNYTASDLGMTVGFGLGLRVGSRMTETREVSLVYECSVYCNRPPNGDQTLQSRSEPRHLPPVPPLSLPGSAISHTNNYSASKPLHIFARSETLRQVGWRREWFPLCLDPFTLWQSSERGLHHHYCGFRALCFPPPGGIKWTVPSRQRQSIPTV